MTVTKYANKRHTLALKAITIILIMWLAYCATHCCENGMSILYKVISSNRIEGKEKPSLLIDRRAMSSKSMPK